MKYPSLPELCTLIFRRSSIYIFFPILFLIWSGVWAQSNAELASKLTSPALATTIDQNLTKFTWTSAEDANQYLLRAGTSKGAYDLAQTYSGTKTSTSMDLPLDGNPIHITLLTRFTGGGTYYPRYYVFQTSDNPTDNGAQIIKPADGNTLNNQITRFQWTPAENANQYLLRAGTSKGAYDLAQTYSGTKTSTSMDLTLDGSPVHFTLLTRFDGGSSYYPRHYVFQTSDNPTDNGATITSPAPGITLNSRLTRFEWTSAENATQYLLKMGTSKGSHDLGQTYAGTSTSTSMDIPINGSPIHVTLLTRFSGGNAYYPRYFIYQASANPMDNGATITSPTPGTTLNSRVTQFEWTAAENATQYLLKMGTSKGSHDLGQTYAGTSTSTSMDIPINGSPIHVTLLTRFSGGNAYYPRYFIYQASANPTDNGATITSPTPGTTLNSRVTQFEWTAAENATQYLLKMGTSKGSHDLGLTYAGISTSTSMDIPIDGSSIHVTLLTRFTGGNAYYPRYYVYQTGLNPSDNGATITSPAPGSTLNSRLTRFEWTAAENANQYLLKVGTNKGGHDLVLTYAGTSTSTSMDIPIDGSLIHVTLLTRFNGGNAYFPKHYVYQTSVNPTDNGATITSPAPGSTLNSRLTRFEWTTAENATQYLLKVGTNKGSHDLGQTYAGTSTSTSMDIPINGSPIHVTLLTRFSGGNAYYPRYFIYQASANPTDNGATITSPTPGTTLNSRVTQFEWTAAENATQYLLKMGTSKGSHDLGQTYAGTSTSTSMDIPINGSPIHVTLLTRFSGGNAYYPRYFIYQASANPTDNGATITSPTAGTTLNSRVTQFEWTAAENATQYLLKMGTSKGSHDLGQTYAGTSTSTSMDIPINGSPIHVTLLTRFSGGNAYYPRYFIYQASANPTDNGPQLVVPAPNNNIKSGLVLFQWTASENANQYFLRIGTSKGAYNLGQKYTGVKTSTSIDLEIPTDTAVHVTLLTRYIGGNAYYPRYYMYTTIDPNGDEDGDGIPNGYEDEHGLDQNDPSDRDADKDGDGLTNYEEYSLGISASNSDTDGDGAEDGTEVAWDLDPADSTNFRIDENNEIEREIERKAIHVLNRLTYGPTSDLFDQLYPEANQHPADSEEYRTQFANDFSDSFESWLDDQFNSPGIRIGYEDEVGNITFKHETLRRTSHFDPVDLDELTINLEGGLSSLYTEEEKQAGLPVCTNNMYHFKDGSKPLEFKHLRDCLVAYQQYCISLTDETGKKINDPAQCMRDVHRGEKFNTVVGTLSVTSTMAAMRPMHSNQHLRTLVADFWDNHFHTNVEVLNVDRDVNPERKTKLIEGSKPSLRDYDVDTYFINAFGNFYNDLLLQSARSPAMLQFLNNDESTFEGPNENYAREVMELHTLGADNGYTQDDIYQLARILTGWQIERTSTGEVLPYHGRYKKYSWYVNGVGPNNENLKRELVNPEFNPDAKDRPFHNFWLATDQTIPGENNVNYYFGAVANYTYNGDDHDDGTNGYGIEGPCKRDSDNPENNEDFCYGNKIFLDFEIGTHAERKDPSKVSVKLDGKIEGEFALKAIAYHPNAAIFVCTKMYQLLVEDRSQVDVSYSGLEIGNTLSAPYKGNVEFVAAVENTANSTIAECAQVFWDNRTNDHQIEHALRKLIQSEEFLSPEIHRTKSKDAAEFTYSLNRLFAKSSPDFHDHFIRRPGYVLGAQGGDIPYTHGDPDGLPELSNDWQNLDQVRRRMEVVRRLTGTHWFIDGSLPSPVTGESFNIHRPDVTCSGCAQSREGFDVYEIPAIHEERLFRYFIEEICPQARSLAACGPDTDKNIARYLLRMVFGGYYTGSDVQLIFETLNPSPVSIPNTNNEVNYSGLSFQDATTAGAYSWIRGYEAIYRLAILARVIASVPEFNLQ